MVINPPPIQDPAVPANHDRFGRRGGLGEFYQAMLRVEKNRRAQIEFPRMFPGGGWGQVGIHLHNIKGEIGVRGGDAVEFRGVAVGDRTILPAAAVKTLETVFHPVFRDGDLYARAVAHRDGKRYLNALGMEFALVPKGTFWMGGQEGKCGDKQVTIDQDFYIGVYPVTQEEWQKVMGTTPSYFRKRAARSGQTLRPY